MKNCSEDSMKRERERERDREGGEREREVICLLTTQVLVRLSIRIRKQIREQ